MKGKIKELRKELLDITMRELMDAGMMEELILLNVALTDLLSMIKVGKKPFNLKGET